MELDAGDGENICSLRDFVGVVLGQSKSETQREKRVHSEYIYI